MKKILHWLDENLEEFILVVFLIAMTLIMGIQVFCRYLYLEWLLKCQLLQQKMSFHQNRTVCCCLSTKRQSTLQSRQSHF